MRIHHIALVVNNLDESLKFYQDALGMKVTERREVPEEGVEIAFLPAGDAELELLRPLSPDNTIGQFLAKRGEGMHHVCMAVPDVEATVAQLTAAGAQIIGAVRTRADGLHYAFIHPKSTHGVLLELYEDRS